MADPSNGYEAIAGQFLAARSTGVVGTAVVRSWAQTLPSGAAVLDLGCGGGLPISRILVEQGFAVAGVDASPTMVAAFQENFPGSRCERATAQESKFLDGNFDAVIAWGLLFLLAPYDQRLVIGKVADALKAGGQFLFTAPEQVCEWDDAMTGLRSVSLGLEEYRRVLNAADMRLMAVSIDEGDNFYYVGLKI